MNPAAPAATEPEGLSEKSTASAAEVPWQRLSVRAVWIAVIRLLVSAVPGYLGAFHFDQPIGWLIVASAMGMAGALLGFRRWVTTRYRVTPDRVEMRTGWLVKKYRYVARDVVRSVDISGRLWHRILGIRVVHVGSGEEMSAFWLDALTLPGAQRLQQELMSTGVTAPAADELDADPTESTVPAAQAPPPETVIARRRRRWLLYNVFTVWSVAVVLLPLVSLYWLLRPFGIDLLGHASDFVGTLGWLPAGLLAVGVLVPLGMVLRAVTFGLEYGNFVLVRAGSPPQTSLITRRGLLSTRTVYRDERRVRGVALREPLLWRWLPLAEVSVVSSGLLMGGEGEPASKLLPRVTRGEAHQVAAQALPDGHTPLEAPLQPHPRSALTRRLVRAAAVPVGAAGLLAWLGATGAVPGWVWPVPLALLPVTLVLGYADYRALGHALVGPYLVVRGGGWNRSTVALQHRAVVGWKLEQSLLQRWRGRLTVGVATAAGDRFYQAQDAGTDQALALVRGATPELAAVLIE